LKTIVRLLFVTLCLAVFSACTPSEPFTAKSVIKKGGVVSYGIGEKADNLIQMFAFMDKVKSGEKSNIRIANFWDKKSFIDDIAYDGKVFKWTQRTTPSDKGTTTVCHELDDEGNGIIGLKGCQGKHKVVGILAAQSYFYNKAKYDYEHNQGQ
jgi:hypothetical protein